MTEISVATWNLHQAVDKRPDNIARTWAYLETTIVPTIALVQEALTVAATAGGNVASRSEAGYSTAVVGYGAVVAPLADVVTRYSRRHKFQIAPRVPGAFAAAHVASPPGGVPLIAISLYGIMAPLYAQTGLLRAIADLIPLFDTPALNRRIVLGGDLNVYDQTTDKTMQGRWGAILSLLESLGLVNLLKATQAQRGPLPGCPCRQRDCWHAETFRHRNRRSSEPGYFTTDYLFATPGLATRLTALEIWNDRPEVWDLSDHAPLVARFRL